MRAFGALILVALVAILIAAWATSLKQHNYAPTPLEQEQSDEAAADAKTKETQAEHAKVKALGLKVFEPYEATAKHGEMVVEGRGKIEFELYPGAAPKTVAHITELASKHFFDGLLFHRVISGFVAQVGDPATRKADQAAVRSAQPDHSGFGTGGSGTTVPLEVNLPHVAGTIGLARAYKKDTGDSQVFINLTDNLMLDPDFCVFGRVTGGMDIAQSIKQGDRLTSLTVH